MDGKVVCHRQFLYDAAHSASRLAKKIASTVDQQWEPLLIDGESMPDLITLLLLIRRRLLASAEDLQRPNETHGLAGCAEQRAQARQLRAAQQVAAALEQLRCNIVAVHGPSRARAWLGFRGEVASLPPQRLLYLGLSVLEILRQSEPPWHPASLKRATASLDLEPAAAALRAGVAELRLAVDAGQGAQCRMRLAVAEQRRTLEQLDHEVRSCIQLLESLCRLADLDHEADRLRPEEWRAGRWLAGS